MRNEPLSLAEHKFICGIVKILRKGGSNELAFNVGNCKSCKDYNFRRRYLLFGNDLNENNSVTAFLQEIPFGKKKDDANYLHRDYIEWEIY